MEILVVLWMIGVESRLWNRQGNSLMCQAPPWDDLQQLSIALVGNNEKLGVLVHEQPEKEGAVLVCDPEFSILSL